MIAKAFCFNKVAEKQADGSTKTKVSFNVGYLLARLIVFGAGFGVGNTAEPFDRLRVKQGKPQLDKKETVALPSSPVNKQEA